MGKALDLKEKRFGILVAKTVTKDRRGNGSLVWECECDCGNVVFITSNSLMQGRSNSCGCLRTEAALKNRNKVTYYNGTIISQLTDKMYKNNISGHKGVCWDKKRGKWLATINLKSKHFFLGYFNKIEDAIQARKEAEEKYFAPIIEEYKLQEENK